MRCLIVDDSNTPRQVMEHLANRSGLQTTSVSSGREALALVGQNAGFDVALIDLEMPKMSGIETIRQLRRVSPMLRILVVSAYHDPARVMAALSAGANGYLIKDELAGSLVRFIRDIQAGHTPLSPRVATVVLASHERQLAESERHAAVGRLARRIMREIEDPLALVGGYTDFCEQVMSRDVLSTLEALYPSFDAEATRAALEMLRMGVNHMTSVVHDISELGKTEEATRHASDVGRVLDLAARMARHASRDCARIELDINEEIWAGIPPSRLCQVLLSLIGHAADTIRERHDSLGTITLRAWTEDGRVIIDVEDTGRGLTQFELEHAFDPLWHSRSGEHRGVRLSIARDIIGHAGGDLDIASRVGVGTAFRIRLPLAADGDLLDRQWRHSLMKHRRPEPKTRRKSAGRAEERQPRIGRGSGSHGIIIEDEE